MTPRPKHATRHTYGWLLITVIAFPLGLAFGAWLA